MDIAQILEKAKTTANIDTDYALAKVLGIPNGWISEFRATPPKRHPSVEVATKLAILAKIPEMEVIAQIELLTAKTDEKKKFWQYYLQERGITACLTMTALALVIALAPAESEAKSILQLKNYGAETPIFSDWNIHYAQRIRTIRLVFKALFQKCMQTLNPYHPAHNYKPIMF